MPGAARYDGIAEWYDRELASAGSGLIARAAVARLLGGGEGRLLDVGCGGGAHALALADLGWRVTGVDVSEDQLRLARERGVEVVRADAESLPFGDTSFDAAVSIFTHTDVDDFAAVLREIARVLEQDGPFVYLGVHPCFVGPHSRFVAGEGLPTFHGGYLQTERYEDGPGVTAEGLRAKVGAAHLPLAAFLQAFLDAGFRPELIEEPVAPDREYPHLLALRCRR